MTGTLRQILKLVGIATDPASPVDGALWYNSTEGRLKSRADGVTIKVIEATWPALTAARWFPTQQGPSSTVAPANNRTYFVPFMTPIKSTLTGIAIDIPTAATTGTARAGLADDTGGLLPNQMKNDYGTVSITTTGVKTWAVSTALKANVPYHVAIQTIFTGTPQVRMAQGMHPWISDDGATPNLNATLNTYYTGDFTGAFTLNAAISISGIVGGPRVSLKFSVP